LLLAHHSGSLLFQMTWLNRNDERWTRTNQRFPTKRRASMRGLLTVDPRAQELELWPG